MPEPKPRAAAPEPEPAPRAVEPEPAQASGNGKTFVSPVVGANRSRARRRPRHGPGTGRGGRVTKKDMLAHLEERPAAAAAPDRTGSRSGSGRTAASSSCSARRATRPRRGRRDRRADERHAPRRRRAHAPLARHFGARDDRFEIDLTKVVNIRQRLKPEYQQRYGVNLTYLAFIARATVAAIENWPWVNGEIRGDTIVRKQFVNLGIAVALEGGKGLIVPVIRNAEGLNLLGTARAIADLAERARTKKLVPDDVQGGTFTITNPGGWGAIIGTPIISQPQVAILDVEALVKRPVVIEDENGNDAIAIRSMMNLCLSYDHRLVDGAYAAQFMKELRENLEGWGEDDY